MNRSIGIGLLGLGVVGTGVAEAITQKAEALGARCGVPLELRAILIRNPNKPRSFRPPSVPLTTDPQEVIGRPDVSIVVEVMGGEQPAAQLLDQALRLGKHVVTANKEVMAKHGPELMAQAESQGLQLRFEASVGGGIPIIGPLRRDLAANDIRSIRAIINGTTNYILCQMARRGLDFATALRQAQELGYAEPDPANDVEGVDAAYKLAILASLAFRTHVHASAVYHEGITRLQARDFRYAHELGYEVKLLAIGKKANGAVHVRVHPAMVPLETPLAKVEGAFNAIEVEGDLTGRVMFHGQGAGAAPTSSAILGDIVAVARGMAERAQTRRPLSQRRGEGPWHDPPLAITPMADLEVQYFMRLNVADRAGVFAQIARVLGENNISIAAVIQKDADPKEGTAEVVITTHPARESAVQKALGFINRLEVVREISNLIRMERD